MKSESRRLWLHEHPRTVEVASVLGVLIALHWLVFRGYYTGSAIPKYDFTGPYSQEAYAWWHDGSFFDPPQWMRYMYGGYPAVSNLQNGSYYLPIGVTAAFTPFTLHAAAVLSALHVAFGAVGMYVFLRRWGARIGPALVGLTAWTFAPGFFAHATAVDFMRGYAWLPWVMLIASVKWPWRHAWWAAPLATLMLWLVMLGAYPGQLVALAYTLPLWVAANQFRYRPKVNEFIAPLLLAGAAAVLMTMIRFLPALLERGVDPVRNRDSSQVSFGTLGTVLFSSENPRLPWFPEHSSYFLPATVLALMAFAPVRHKLVQALLAVGGFALVLGLPIWPWHDLLSRLAPGMDLSRFRMSDFRFITLFCAVAIAAFALQSLLARPHVAAIRSERERWMPVVILVALCNLLAYVGAHYSYDRGPALAQWILLTASATALVVLWWRGWRVTQAIVVAACIVAIAISGLVQAQANKRLWTSDRERVEQQIYGAEVDALLSRRDDASAEQRPARLATRPDYKPTDVNDLHNNIVFYTGQSSVIGYINLKGTETYELIRRQIDAPGERGADTRAFWAAAGVVIEGEPNTIPNAAAIEACAEQFECGTNLEAHPVDYGTDGHFVYRVTASDTIHVMLNEAHYRGWRAMLCDQRDPDECRTIATTRGSSGQITLELPEGQWLLQLDYRLPGQRIAWWLFATGVAIAIALGVQSRLRA